MAPRLAAANVGKGSWDPGWRVEAAASGQAAIIKNGLRLFAWPDEYRKESDRPTVPGDLVSLLWPKDCLGLSPGYFTALGDEPLEDAGRTRLRLYWHIRPEGAVQLIRRITTELNASKVGFRFKVVDDLGSYGRCDAAVLYISDRDFPRVTELLAGSAGDLREGGALDQEIPAFTKRLAHGLGLAEDPPDGDSFGLNRCTLLARALTTEEGTRSRSAALKLRLVEEMFSQAGVDMLRPYLNAGSDDAYDLPAGPEARRAARLASDPSLRRGRLPEDYFGAADAVGSRLAQGAIWHEGRCNWLSPRPRTGPGQDGAFVRLGSLGPDLYGGTSGIALFLAELQVRGGSQGAGRIAVGAARQALAAADRIAPQVRAGLYSGWPGIAVAVAWAGSRLGEPELVDRAIDLAHRLPTGRHQEGECDLISGTAGAVLGLLWLHASFGDDRLLEKACALGKGLARTADRSAEGCSWGSAASPGSPNLTGLSHGAAGIGLAMFTLYESSGETEFLTLGRMAFQYERHWFDRRVGNWPDLRWRTRRSRRPASFATTWCHGAPGIALSRARGYELRGDQEYRDEAAIAARTTERELRVMAERGFNDFSLCHGAGGLASILLDVEGVLGEGTVDGQLISAIGAEGLARYPDANNPWPCGVGMAETPELMTGLAGIGWFYLRLAEPTLPSILLMRPDNPDPGDKGPRFPRFGARLASRHR